VKCVGQHQSREAAIAEARRLLEGTPGGGVIHVTDYHGVHKNESIFVHENPEAAAAKAADDEAAAAAQATGKRSTDATSLDEALRRSWDVDHQGKG
jgi:hypothetical protein